MLCWDAVASYSLSPYAPLGTETRPTLASLCAFSPALCSSLALWCVLGSARDFHFIGRVGAVVWQISAAVRSGTVGRKSHDNL